MVERWQSHPCHRSRASPTPVPGRTRRRDRCRHPDRDPCSRVGVAQPAPRSPGLRRSCQRRRSGERRPSPHCRPSNTPPRQDSHSRGRRHRRGRRDIRRGAAIRSARPVATTSRRGLFPHSISRDGTPMFATIHVIPLPLHSRGVSAKQMNEVLVSSRVVWFGQKPSSRYDGSKAALRLSNKVAFRRLIVEPNPEPLRGCRARTTARSNPARPDSGSSPGAHRATPPAPPNPSNSAACSRPRTSAR